jgi:hypothetical protein
MDAIKPNAWNPHESHRHLEARRRRQRLTAHLQLINSSSHPSWKNLYAGKIQSLDPISMFLPPYYGLGFRGERRASIYLFFAMLLGNGV